MNDFESDLRAAQAVKKPMKQQREQAEELTRIDHELRLLLTEIDHGGCRSHAVRARALLQHRKNVAESFAEAGGDPWTFTMEGGL